VFAYGLEKKEPAMMKHVSIGCVALLAFAGAAVADDQDDQVRQLNLEQLEKAKSDNPDASIPEAMPAPSQPDGVGGPELTGPPTPEEGMTDDEEATDDIQGPADEDATPPDGSDEPKE
jgi:hypothetical protein